MRKVLLAFVVFWSLNGFALAQGVPVAPDLANADWKLVQEQVIPFHVLTGVGENWSLMVTTQVLNRFYGNDKAKQNASLIIWPAENGDEIAMFFGGGDEPWAAIKVNGQWHTAKAQGTSSLKVSVIWGDNNKPIGLKFNIETQDGPMERVLVLK